MILNLFPIMMNLGNAFRCARNRVLRVTETHGEYEARQAKINQ